MFLSDWAAWPARQVVCILIGLDNFYPQSFTVSGRERFLTEKDLHTRPEVLRDASTLVLIIGEKAGPETVELAVEVIRKNLILAECFCILDSENHPLLDKLLEISAVLQVEKDDFNLLVQSSILGQFLGFLNCDNGWVRLDKADIRSVINTGHLGRLKLISACGQKKFAEIFKKLQTRFPHEQVKGLILYLVSGVQTSLSEIEPVFSGFPEHFSPDTLVLFGVGIEDIPELSDCASCFLLY